MDIKLPNNVLIITLAFIIVCDAMRDLVLFVQFKKRENTHGGALLLVMFYFSKSNTPPWVFFTFLNCINGSKSRAKHHIFCFVYIYKRKKYFRDEIEFLPPLKLHKIY